MSKQSAKVATDSIERDTWKRRGRSARTSESGCMVSGGGGGCGGAVG